MDTALVNFDPAALAVALKQTHRESGTGAAAFLKMEKSGDWVFGAEQEPLDEGTTLMIDPRSFMHGHVAWEEGNLGNKLGEAMGPVILPMPTLGPIPPGADRWQFQLGVGMVLNDQPLMYAATSVGGRRAIGALAAAIGEKMAARDPACVPIVTLDSESYIHKKWGKVHNPVIEIQTWTTMAKLLEDPAAKSAPPAPPPAAPAKKTRKAAK